MDQIQEERQQSPPSRQPVSARGRRTRAKLLESGREALAERGQHQTRVDDVVSRAGTSHGTFYLYFENIEDLVAGVIEQCDAEAATLLGALGGVRRGDIDGLAGVLARIGQLYETYGEVASPWVRSPGSGHNRVVALSRELGMGADRALGVLSLIDRLLPELGPQHPDGHRRIAALIETISGGATPQPMSVGR